MQKTECLEIRKEALTFDEIRPRVRLGLVGQGKQVGERQALRMVTMKGASWFDLGSNLQESQLSKATEPLRVRARSAWKLRIYVEA